MTKAYSYPEPYPVGDLVPPAWPWTDEQFSAAYYAWQQEPGHAAHIEAVVKWETARYEWYGRQVGAYDWTTYGPPVPSRRERRAADRVTPTNRTCVGCSVTIRNGTRADSRYCSSACRQRAYRQRVTAADRRSA